MVDQNSAQLPSAWSKAGQTKAGEAWDPVDAFEWRCVVRTIEGAFLTEASKPVRRRIHRWNYLFFLFVICMIPGFMAGFPCTVIGCSGDDSTVCIVGVICLIFFAISFFGLPISFFRIISVMLKYAQGVLDTVNESLPGLVASHPSLSFAIVDIQPTNGAFTVLVTAGKRRPVHHTVVAWKQETPPTAIPTWHAPRQEDMPVPMPTSLPQNWTHRDPSAGHFQERIEVSAKIRDVLQDALIMTFLSKSTRDRKGKVPGRLRLLKCHRVEHSKLWYKYQQGKELVRTKRPLGCTPIEELCAASPSPAAIGVEDAPSARGVRTNAALGEWFTTQLSEELNEFYLWHGTGPAGAFGITDTGFRLDLSGSYAGSMFGRGAYFAECSSKADEYSQEGDGIYAGVYALLLCRVTCGKMLRMLRSNDSLVEEMLASGSHESVLGDREASVGTYREFVAFDEARVYPEYVILYERVQTATE